LQQLPAQRNLIERILGKERVDSIVTYVTTRRNADGGYTSTRETDSNSLDTYFGLAVFHMLEHPVEGPDKTLEWLDRFPVRDLRSAYYVTNAYAVLQDENAYLRSDRFHQVTSILRDIYRSDGYFGSERVHREAASEFETNYMAVELASDLDLPFDRDGLVRNLMSTMNPDGGFGLSKGSDIISTYHVVLTVTKALGRTPESSRVKDWVVSCESPTGGFPVRPRTLPSCMEYTYSGVMTLSAFGLSPKFPNRIEEFVESCQRNTGGFSRSETMGIPIFEHTFQAVRTIAELERYL